MKVLDKIKSFFQRPKPEAEPAEEKAVEPPEIKAAKAPEKKAGTTTRKEGQ